MRQPPTRRPVQNAPEPAFVSQQVSESRRYYLDLTPSQDADFIVVCGGRERLRPDYVIERTTFPFHCVELVVAGRGSVVLNGKRYVLTPGTIFAYGPSVAHTIRTDSTHPMTKYYIDFTGHRAEALLAGTVLGNWSTARVVDPNELSDIFDAIDREAG
jgi:hypothetical protein